MQGENKGGSDQGSLIIRRIKRRAHGGHGGGAWKVAFADFVLALMSLFLVLWIMNIAPKPERRAAAAEAAGNPIFDGGVGIFQLDSKTPRINPLESQAASSERGARDRSIDSEERRRALATLIQSEATKLGMDGNISVAINDDGVRISIHDSAQKGMFAQGRDELNPMFIKLLNALAKILADIPNRMVVTGHTDSTQFTSSSVFDNNWGLSSRRALRVRQSLLDGGVDEGKIFQVSGMGDSVPLEASDATLDMNRRVELLILTSKAAEDWLQKFMGHGMGVDTQGSEGLTVRDDQQ